MEEKQENEQFNKEPSVIDAMIERLINKPEDKADQDLVQVVISLLKGYEHLAAKLGVLSGQLEMIDFNVHAVAGGIGTLVEFLDVSRIIRTGDLESFERSRASDLCLNASEESPDLRLVKPVTA